MSNDYTVGDTIYFKFTTRAFATGVPTVLAGTPVLSAYEDASVTQITAGVSITVDLDSVAGLNLATIVATGGNGFESGKHYGIVITTGTVSGVSVVGEVIGQFTLEKSAAAVDLANGTDGLGALKVLIDTIDDLLDTEISAITAAVITNAAGADIAADIIALKAETVLIVADTNELQGDDVPGLIAALNDIAAGDMWAVDATTQQTQGTFGQAIGDPVADADTIYGAVVTGAAGANIAVDIIALKAETVLIVADTSELQGDWVDAGRLDAILDIIAADVVNIDGAAMRGTDSAALASVCTEARLAELAAANLPADIDAILADSNELQGDWVNGGRLDLILDARMAEASIDTTGGAVDTVTTLTGHTAQSGDSFARLGAPAGASIAADLVVIDDFVDGIETAVITNAAGADIAADIIAMKAETVLIVADTDELQGDWVNGGRLDLILDAILLDTGTTLDGKIDTIDDFLDTEIAAIKVVTDKLDSAQAEPGQGTPAVNETPLVKLAYLFKQWRNKSDNDGSTVQLFNDDTSTVDQKRTVSEAAGTVTKAEMVTGP